MKIGINATYLGKEHKTGVEKFSSSAISFIIKTKQHQFHLFSQLPINVETEDNVILHVSKFPKGWHSLRLPLSLSANPVDLFIEMGYSVPPFTKIPVIVVVHDLAYKYFPEAYSPKQISSFDHIFNNISQKAAGIIFVSQNTKLDFEKHFPNSNAMKRVIYQSIPEIKAISNIDHKTLSLPEKYILSVGRLEHRKNTVKLIEAYSFLRQKYQDFDHKLLLVGSRGYGYKEVARAISASGQFSNDIVELGYASDSDLQNIYQQADVFVYPSLYEGFGIPILESFKAGTPVVCSNSSSLPEVGGEAVMFCDPKNCKNIAEGIHSVISDNNLRCSLRDMGKQQLKKFTWQKFTVELMDFIKEVYESRSSS